MVEQSERKVSFEVFAWGHGYVGTRPTLEEAGRLAAGYEGARILFYDERGFHVAAELGRFAEWRRQKRAV